MKSLKTDIGDVYEKEGTKRITDCLRGIRNAWHFYYALVSVFKVVYGPSVLRCLPLNSTNMGVPALLHLSPKS